MSQMWDDILPYNKVNKEISHSEITNLLTRFNVNEKLNNIKIYRTAFANKSYITSICIPIILCYSLLFLVIR